MNGKLRAVVVLGTMLVFATTASALIKIDFTPIDLVKDSDVIVLLEMVKVDDQGVAHAKVTKVVKGEMAGKEITIDLAASELSKVAGEKMKDFIKQGQKEALLFVGRFNLSKDAGGGEEPELAGYLHTAGEWTDNSQNEWFVLNSVPDSDNAKWDMSKIDSELLGVWNGSTDMLLRCVEYINSEEKPIVPCLANANWAEESLVAKLTGKVFAAKGVDLTGKSATGQGDLFIAADSGDKVYRYADGKMADITEKVKLTSKSRMFAFGDFNGDGTLDLLSFDGKALSLYAQAADGTFAAAKACDAGDALAGGVVSMATTDVGAKGKPGVVIGTKAWPLLATLADDGKVTVKALGTGEFSKDAGEASQCLVADFDNDGVVDVVQLCARGGYFYKGKAPGEFAAAARTQIACGEGRNAAALGDFDADGLQDIIVVAEDRNRLWHNLGGGKFVNMLVGSGEIFYHPKTGGIAVDTADFNNDMRTDVLIIYGIEQKPHIFFNRGFRSFGQAYSVDLDELHKLDQAREGQQAGCLGEFTGDGAIDQVLVLKNGEVWFFPRKVENPPERAVVAAVALGGPTAGPITVCASKDDLPFGSQVVRAGDPGALFGMPDVGPVLLTWKTPDGKQHEQVVNVEAKKRLVRVTLQADAK